METPSSTFVILGLVFAFYALAVESQSGNGPVSASSVTPSSPPPTPPPPLPPPPSSPLPPTSSKRQPPPAPSRKVRPSSAPPLDSRFHNRASNDARNGHRRRKRPPPPPPASVKMNMGKKIGLSFVGIAAILQIGVVSFLVIKRKQLLKMNDSYEPYLS